MDGSLGQTPGTRQYLLGGALLVAEAANDFPTKASRAGIDELWRLLSEAREAFREVAGGVDFEEDPY